MSRPRSFLTVALIAMSVAAVVAIAVKARNIRQVANQTVDDVETEIDSLDPVTRAVVVAKLSADEAKRVEALRT